MNPFAQKVAVVTGGASGIGRALGEELARHGARVVLADINLPGLEAAAAACQAGGRVQTVCVDVTDAAAVARLIESTFATQRRLDYLFNNAGVATMGDARHMTHVDWARLIDVNLRGVIHGVSAAYPMMIQQGFGHIINTASLAGLVPTPGAVGYSVTKHAVVGLSTSLRGEAARFGVRVSAACPGFIDTPIAQATRWLSSDAQTVVAAVPFRLYPAAACARDILAGVRRNRGLIVVTRHAKLAWLLYRWAPRLFSRMAQVAVERSPLIDGGPGNERREVPA